MRIGAWRKNIITAQPNLCGAIRVRDFEPEAAVGVGGGMPGTVEALENTVEVAAIGNYFVLNGLIYHRVKSFSIFFPLTGCAYHFFALLNLDGIEHAGTVRGMIGFLQPGGIVELSRFECGVLFEFTLGIKPPSD